MVSHGKKELGLGDYVNLVNKNKYVLVLSIISFMLPTWYFIHKVPDYFIASSQIVMDEKKNNLMLTEEPAMQKNIGYYRAIFQSQAFLDKLQESLSKELDKAKVKTNRHTYLLGHITMEEGSFESFLSIKSKTPSPQLSYALTKTATDSLIIFCRKVENEEVENAVTAIREQIEICVRKRDDIQKEKNLYTDATQLANLGDMAGLNALEKNYQEELVKLELDKANLEAKKNYFHGLDQAVNKSSQGPNDSALLEYRKQLHILEKEKEKMLRMGIPVSAESKITIDLQAAEEKIVRLSKKNEPQDLNLLNQWQGTRKEVVASEAELQMKKARLDAFKRAIVNYRQNHPDLGKQEIEIQQLDALLERYRETHKRLTERLEDAVIHLQSKSGGLKLVDAAQVPTDPIPRRDLVFYLISLLIGLAAGIALGLVREFMDDSVKSPDDVEKRLGLTLLGTIPHVTVKKTDIEIRRNFKKDNRTTINNKYPELLLSAENQESIVAEAYRSLRTNIVFASPDKTIQTLLISSSGPGEGKSLTMANTALTFAQQGEPTLIIDTDLRRPVTHHLFGFDRGPGFGELFAGSRTLDEVIRKVPGTNLNLITAGAYTPNPAELLGSKKMDSLLEELKKRFRFILFDTPPVIAVTDACILATKVDGAVIVIRAGKTSLAVSERTLQSLRNVNGKVLGCILNDVDLTKGYSSYGYYKHYYHNYVTKKD